MEALALQAQEAWEGREQGTEVFWGGQDSSDEGQSSRVPGPPGGSRSLGAGSMSAVTWGWQAEMMEAGGLGEEEEVEEEETDARPEFAEEGRGTVAPGRRGDGRSCHPGHHWGWRGS